MKAQKNTPAYHRERIARQTIKNPFLEFLGGPTEQESKKYLKNIGYSDKELACLTSSKTK